MDIPRKIQILNSDILSLLVLKCKSKLFLALAYDAFASEHPHPVPYPKRRPYPYLIFNLQQSVKKHSGKYQNNTPQDNLWASCAKFAEFLCLVFNWPNWMTNKSWGICFLCVRVIRSHMSIWFGSVYHWSKPQKRDGPLSSKENSASNFLTVTSRYVNCAEKN